MHVYFVLLMSDVSLASSILQEYLIIGVANKYILKLLRLPFYVAQLNHAIFLVNDGIGLGVVSS